ncbi:hypothetical protein NO995_10290 [Aestuariibaculum sp. M13]|uniref:hypothetical protein n=1 Tax=Aestuariibaculum sp. M13 TaxID=2967132 RepID=UPI002159C6ED|nr:hypothetical protein [Aestuariibaculum sp. M13]MCR8668072.1 hypothetical protein [Aestuariibaculum sp. M13]
MKKTYQPNNKLLKTLLRENLYFAIGLIILTPILYYFREGKQFVWDFPFVKIMAVILIIYNLPNFIIYWDYYKENKTTKIKFDTESNRIGITKNGVQKQYEISEIKSSIYHLGVYYKNRIDDAKRWKMINSDLAYWDLEFNNGDRYYISNLLVDFLHDAPIVQNTKYRFRMFQYINKSDSKEAVELKQTQEKNRTKKFVDKFQSKSESELNYILNNKSKYQKEAVKAVEIIIKNKNVG